MEYIIYTAKNVKNGKCYVGRTSHTLTRRKHQHEVSAYDGKKTKLAEAIREYGTESFLWEIISTVENQEVANTLEIYWIGEMNTLYPNGYNSNRGGARNSERMTRETKEKVRLSNTSRENSPIGKKLTLEHREKLRLSHTGVKTNDDTKEKIRKAMKERIFTNDHKKNLSEAGRKRITTDSLREAMREGQRKRWARARGEIV
jgi:group I intron endonuclease